MLNDLLTGVHLVDYLKKTVTSIVVFICSFSRNTLNSYIMLVCALDAEYMKSSNLKISPLTIKMEWHINMDPFLLQKENSVLEGPNSNLEVLGTGMIF